MSYTMDKGETYTRGPLAKLELEHKILDLLHRRPGLDLGQLSALTGVKRGPANNPLASELNQALKRLRDNGQIRTNNQWGDPRFFLTEVTA